MNDSQDSFKQECNKLEAIVATCAAGIAVTFLGTFIIFFGTRFTG
jgi:hypothetical protein